MEYTKSVFSDLRIDVDNTYYKLILKSAEINDILEATSEQGILQCVYFTLVNLTSPSISLKIVGF